MLLEELQFSPFCEVYDCASRIVTSYFSQNFVHQVMIEHLLAQTSSQEEQSVATASNRASYEI